MDEDHKLELSWQVILTIIAAVLLASLVLFYLLFRLFFLNHLGNTQSSTPPKVLGASTGDSPSPNVMASASPKATAIATSTPQFTPFPSPSPQHAQSSVPTSVPQPQPSPTLPIADSFEAGLGTWSSIGDVLLMNTLTNQDGYTSPQSGLQMVRIGRPKNQGKPISQNQLSISLPVGVHSITFFYDFFSYDYQGFDEPGFEVLINNSPVFSLKASDVDTDKPQATTENLDTSHWQQKKIDVSNLNLNGEAKLTFEAGNDEENLATEKEHQSWVYIDSVKIE